MSIRKRMASFRYAFRGLNDLVKTQPNARIHLAATVVAGMAGIYLGLNKSEWITIVLCAALVWALEAVNTAIEYLTDLVSPAYHPLAGKAKDVSAAAVLIAAIAAIVIGATVFLPKLGISF